MLLIHKSLDCYISALEKKDYLVTDGHSSVWKREHRFIRWFRWFVLLQHEDDLIARVANSFTNILASLEQTPQEIQQDIQKYLKAAKLLKGQLKNCYTKSSKLALQSLKINIVGLRYRLELYPKEKVNDLCFQTLCKKGKEWKENQPLITPKDLSEQDKINLRKVCAYPHFLKLLSNNTHLLKSFFIWTIRNENDPEIFIEFPGTQHKIRMALLSSRISSLRDDGLVLIKENGRKDVKLLIEGKHVSILDGKKIINFERGGLSISIDDLFKAFHRKNRDIGYLEYLGNGINNWNSYELGWYDAEKKGCHHIEMSGEKWWSKLPELRTLSKEDASCRYKQPLDGKKWVFSPSASRQTKQIQFGGAHAYLEIAIPNDNGNYSIYYFGKYPKRFPQSPLEFIKVVACPTPAAVAYPDENIFYKHREHKGYIIKATEDEGGKIMESIKKDILNARKGNLWFQLLIENCALWIWKKLRKHLGAEKVPEIYKMTFVDQHPVGFLGKVFNVGQKFPSKLQYIFFSLIIHPFSKDVTVTKKNGRKRKISIRENPPYAPNQPFHHPGRLFYI